MEYFTLLTTIGASKIAAATAAKTTVNLTHIAVGDGNGTVPMPSASKTALVNEVFRTSLNNLKVDSNNANWITTEGYISSNDGNFWIREVGIFDIDGDLIAIGNYPETFKPVMADGVAKDLYIKVIIEVSSADSITLQIDPSITLATIEYVDNQDALKANLNGNKLVKFKVAPALSDEDAINKKQFDKLNITNDNYRLFNSNGENLTNVISKVAASVNSTNKLKVHCAGGYLSPLELSVLIGGHHNSNGADRWNYKFVFQLMQEGKSLRIGQRISNLEYGYGTNRISVSSVSVENGYIVVEFSINNNNYTGQNPLIELKGATASNLIIENKSV